MEAALVIFASLISGLVGVVVSTWFYRRYEKRKWKLDTLKRLAAHRYAITEGRSLERSGEFFAALNEVFVVFHDAPEVLDALEAMRKETSRPEHLQDNMVKLFKVMCADLNINHRTLNDSFFLTPFAPGRTSLGSQRDHELPG